MAAYPANELPSMLILALRRLILPMSLPSVVTLRRLILPMSQCDLSVFDDGRLILTYLSFTAAYPADELCFFFVNSVRFTAAYPADELLSLICFTAAYPADELLLRCSRCTNAISLVNFVVSCYLVVTFLPIELYITPHGVGASCHRIISL